MSYKPFSPQNPGKFCLWDPESWALESVIYQLKESRILLTIGIWN